MTKLGNIRAIYTDESKKKSAYGIGFDMGPYIKIELRESKRRKKFDTILIPWNNITKVIIMK
jgi:hypothetical protein